MKTSKRTKLIMIAALMSLTLCATAFAFLKISTLSKQPVPASVHNEADFYKKMNIK